jgi:hypothetical protein
MFRSLLYDHPQGVVFRTVHYHFSACLFRPVVYSVCGCMLSMCVCVPDVPVCGMSGRSQPDIPQTGAHPASCTMSTGSLSQG